MDFTKIPLDTFDTIETDVGILLSDFSFEKPNHYEMSDIICATTGGVTIACEPTYSDMGEDVDNCPNNLLEFKHLDGWNCHIDFTSISFSERMIQLALGAADIDPENSAHVIIRTLVKKTDARDLWWAGNMPNGGGVVIHLKNGLSTSGFSMTTTKSGKGQSSLSITGHTTVATQDEVPMEMWIIHPKIEKLEVTSTEGSEEGYTKITVTPKKQAGNDYKYKLGEAAESVAFGDEIKEGWTDWNGVDEINANGQTHITVVEVTADGKAYGAGDKAVTASGG